VLNEVTTVPIFHSLLSWCGGHIYNISPEPAAERSSKIYLHAARPGASASRADATKREGNTTVLNEVTTVPIWTIALPMTLLFPRNLLLDSIGAGVLNFMQWDQWVGYAALWMGPSRATHITTSSALQSNPAFVCTLIPPSCVIFRTHICLCGGEMRPWNREAISFVL
jgi:hypothetical protein